MTTYASLAQKLVARIEDQGPITVAEYMEAALGDPSFGYYMSQEPFGRGGDFITAPEISQMFGELLGLWVAEVWMSMSAPSNVTLAELGPGRGTLMSDVLRTLSRAVPDLHAGLTIHLVEMSPRLRKEQQATLKGERAVWMESIETLPDQPLIILANEFFDALPIHQYVKSSDGWHERLVDLGAGGDAALGFCLAEDPVADISFLPHEMTPRIGVETIAEWRPAAREVIGAVASTLTARGGALLVTDYGYETRAPGDTFQAVKGHKPTHVLYRPGEADLTAHVDFSDLAHAAEEAGLKATKPRSQGEFLKGLGIEPRAETLKAATTDNQKAAIDTALARLTEPDQMGSLFKALAVYSSGLPVPPGFEVSEQDTIL